MAAILGLRGTGDFTADERPRNWREKILQLFPNGEAPLTALMSMLKSQPTDDPEFNQWEKRLPVQRMLAAGAQANVADVTIVMVSGAKDAVAGSIVMNERTNEKMRVDQDPTNDTDLHVVRGSGTTAAAGILQGDGFTIIGNAHAEGSGVPTVKSYSPTKFTNLTQIFRMPFSMTRTAKKTRLRWDNTGPYREAKREALSLYSIEREKAYIWGEKFETIGTNGKPLRMTGGVISFLTSNVGANAPNGNFGSPTAPLGDLDEATLDTMLENIFRYGSIEKLALCGSTFIKAITTLGKRNGTLNVVPTDRAYGMKIVEYISAFGTLMLKNHPLMSQHPVWRQNCLILDVNNLMDRVIDETMLVRNRQNPGDDLSLDEFLGESGLELHYEETHAYLQGVTGALIA